MDYSISLYVLHQKDLTVLLGGFLKRQHSPSAIILFRHRILIPHSPLCWRDIQHKDDEQNLIERRGSLPKRPLSYYAINRELCERLYFKIANWILTMYLVCVTSLA